jgi:hypothetical protein
MYPVDQQLYQEVKEEANTKFNSKSGVYRSAWIVREYKKRGGIYTGEKPTNTGLPRWFQEKWVDINKPIKDHNGRIVGFEKCGRSNLQHAYPLCRPTQRITEDTPKTVAELNWSSLQQALKEKSKVQGTKNVRFT